MYTADAEKKNREKKGAGEQVLPGREEYIKKISCRA